MVSYRLFLYFFLSCVVAAAAVCPFFSHHTHAQTGFMSGSTGEAMRITMTPQYPKAFETVTVTVEDFSRDINNLTISWALNGQVKEKGTGLKTFSFTTGALGSTSNLSITVGGVTQSLVIRPATIDLLWQADSYVPPFYKGKALHSNQDPVTVVAEPFFLTSTGARLDPNTLVYKWSQNGKVVQNASGYGRKTFTVVPSILAKAIDVGVEVTSTSGTYHATARTSIEETAPEVLIYEKSPLYGMRDAHALNGNTFSLGAKPETTFVAVPFFFSTGSRDADTNIGFTWTQNGDATDKTANNIVLRAPAEGGGTALVGVRTKSLTNFMQAANASFTIDFARAPQTSQ